MPRPETELLAGWAIEQARPSLGTGRAPVVVDLCTGSGAIAKASPTRCPTPTCTPSSWTSRRHAWAERNLAGTGVDLRHGDMADGVRRPARHRRRRRLQPAVHPARGLGVGRRRGPRPRPAPGAVLRRRRARRDPGPGACARPLLLRPGGVVGAEHADAQGESAPAVFARHRPLGRGARPPRPGRSSALHDGAAGTMRPACNGATRDDRRRARGRPIEAAAAAPSGGASWSCCPTDTVYGIGADAFDARRRAGAARRQGPRAARCRRRCWSAPRPRSTRWPSASRLRPRPGRGVLARRRSPSSAASSPRCSGTWARPAAPSPSGCPTTRSPSRARAHRPAGRQLRQPAPAARPPPTPTRPRRCSGSRSR